MSDRYQDRSRKGWLAEGVKGTNFGADRHKEYGNMGYDHFSWALQGWKVKTKRSE